MGSVAIEEVYSLVLNLRAVVDEKVDDISLVEKEPNTMGKGLKFT